MAKRSTTTTTNETPVTEAVPETVTETPVTETPVTEAVPETVTETPVTEAVRQNDDTALASGTVTTDGTASEMDDSAMEAMVMAFLARKEAKAKAEAEAKAIAIASAKDKVKFLSDQMAELETEYKDVLGAKRKELQTAIDHLETLAPTPVTQAKAGAKRARDLAVTGTQRVVARSAENSLGLTGTKLKLYTMMIDPDGMTEEEGSDALGWEACGATVSKVLKIAEGAGLAVSKGRDPLDGRVRYRIHVV